MIGMLYRGVGGIAAPFAPLYLDRRASAGKEDPARLGERYGRPIRPRPAGALGWLHGASVGETLSLLPLLQAMAARRPDLSFLVTSGTLTSAGLLAERLPGNAIHQYPPLDLAPWCERFLAHWRPDFGLFVESELWPNLIGAANRRGLPLALVNARMSERSFRRWQWAAGWAKEILRAFDPVLAPDEIAAGRFRRLGAGLVKVTGNLKSAAPALPCDAAALSRFRQAIGARPVLLFASTHEGEETIAAALHRSLAGEIEGLLTILAPRHPARAERIAHDLRELGIRLAQRSRNDLPTGGAELYLADSLGELGLFYRLADLVVMGGSFGANGGHNPLEPARLERAVVTGPDIANFTDLYRRLAAAGACRVLERASALPGEAKRLLMEKPAREAMARAAHEFAEAEAAVLDRVMAALDPFLERALGRAAA